MFKIHASILAQLAGLVDTTERAIETLVSSIDPEMYKSVLSEINRSYLPTTRQKTQVRGDISMEEALYNVRISNTTTRDKIDAGYNVRYSCMKKFGNKGERESKDCVEKLLNIKKWKLVEFLSPLKHEKEYTCLTPNGPVQLRITGRLDGVAKSKNASAVVEIKNRVFKLEYSPREYEMWQVRAYMALTGIPKAFLIERFVEDHEYSSIAVFEQDEDFIQEVILENEKFKESVGKISLFLTNRNEFKMFLLHAPCIKERPFRL